MAIAVADGFARPRARLSGLDASTTLEHFALVTFDVDPDRLAASLPRDLTPEVRTLDDGRRRGFVSAVSFRVFLNEAWHHPKQVTNHAGRAE